MVSLEEPDEDSRSLLVALGRAVLTAGLLEAFVLLAAIRRRRESGWDDDQIAELAEKYGKLPAGQRVRALRDAGAPSELAVRLWAAFKQRNDVVHHLLSDPATVQAIMGGETAPIIAKLDQVTFACGEVLEEIAPAELQGAVTAFGIDDPADLERRLLEVTLEDFDERDGAFIEQIRALPDGQLAQLLKDATANPEPAGLREAADEVGPEL